jgi:hypothetical protein
MVGKMEQIDILVKWPMGAMKTGVQWWGPSGSAPPELSKQWSYQ